MSPVKDEQGAQEYSFPLTSPAQWNEDVSRLGGGLHLCAEWIAFASSRPNLTPLYFHEGKGQEEFLAVAYLVRSSRWPVSRLPSVHLETLPVGPAAERGLAVIEHAAQRLGCLTLSLGSLGAETPFDLHRLGYTEQSRLEITLPLDKGLEAAWNDFKKPLRYELKRFQATDVHCVKVDTPDRFDDILAIELATWDRHAAQGKHHDAMSRETLQRLWRLIPTGRLSIYLASRQAQPLATAVVGSFGQRSYLVSSAATPDGLRCNASKGILWFAMQREFEQGRTSFNFGGVSSTASSPVDPDHGLYQFKMKFGAREVVCTSGHKVLRPMAHRFKQLVQRMAQRAGNGFHRA